ncbi:hypothetical protein K3495_g6836 [Podosphaera aphanis]|nr:hypothetical protein K3495_g6836 [Podosphaera aphanis]
MSSSISTEERQKIINNNRSLRIIKNELESLAEHGGISDEVYDSIMATLPAESPLNASSRLNVVKKDKDNSNSSPNSVPLDAATNTLQNLSLSKDQNPPSYSTSTPPSLPHREQQASPTRPELVRVTGLYRYNEPGDCNFEIGDQIAVYQYMNPDWWLGKNLRTGQEGVFPQNYVRVAYHPAQSAYNNEKAAYPAQYNQQVAQPSTPYYNQAPQVQASNPYNSSVPPMQVAEQPTESSTMGKGGEMGKKLGKKLGNAAIFGAGATIGGNIVNSIF